MDENLEQTPTETPSEEQSSANKIDEVKEPEKSLVPKKITCRRCDGDGIFHSSRTGIRAETTYEPMTDPSRDCPKCKGSKEETIFITHSQALMEVRVDKARKGAEQAALKARVAADHAEKVAKEAEAELKRKV